ncbi:MAG: hypothetical protein H7Z17_07685 [Fuerstia sp.]|nr:hypothetical protein [Fuerstiella sp.]
MLMNESDELLIQRCVDDELSPPETRELLQRLDRLDGAWKKLACELLEDRGMSKAFRSPYARAGVLTAGAESAKPIVSVAVHRPSVGPVAVRGAFRHWWSHPLTSLTLCAAIAFVGGMLVPDFSAGRSNSGVVSNKLTNIPMNLGPAVQGARNVDARAADSYRFQMTPGGQTVDIPVYDGIHDLMRSDRNHPLFSEGVRGSDGRSQQVQWMIMPVGDNKSMLFPVSEDTLGDMQ